MRNSLNESIRSVIPQKRMEAYRTSHLNDGNVYSSRSKLEGNKS